MNKLKSVKYELKVSFWNLVESSLHDSLQSSLWVPLQESLGDSLYDSLQESLGDSLYDSLQESLGRPL